MIAAAAQRFSFRQYTECASARSHASSTSTRIAASWSGCASRCAPAHSAVTVPAGGQKLQRVGWIGTGIMGASMCGHLIDKGINPSTTYTHQEEIIISARHTERERERER